MRPVAWSWLGRVRYEEGLERQRAHRARVIAGVADEAIWLLEHDSVITTGRRPVDGLPTLAAQEAAGIRVVRTERGGLATWHGPGQIVAYAILNAWDRGLGARGTICALEAGVISTLASMGIQSARRTGYPGVWVGTDKICAVGMHFSRGVSMHGIALNLDPDPAGFGLILPCGIRDGGVTSVARLTGAAPTPYEAAPTLGQALQQAIARATREKGPQSASIGLTSPGPSDSSARSQARSSVGRAPS